MLNFTGSIIGFLKSRRRTSSKLLVFLENRVFITHFCDKQTDGQLRCGRDSERCFNKRSKVTGTFNQCRIKAAVGSTMLRRFCRAMLRAAYAVMRCPCVCHVGELR